MCELAELRRLKGAIVDGAASAQIGMSLLASRQYDLLISDASVPEMGGYAFFAEVRRTCQATPPRAVALFGYCRAIDVFNARAAGFDAHVWKPASIGDLKATLALFAKLPPTVLTDG